ncbi:hypothetical protein [Salinibacter ruber]|uniref:hypothetical protein n=1 Tax=Salinibacter ruber TaxID=146919 RepID=UPI000C9F1C35|nr:hypothetical protein [Salinibacter ruber]MCS3612101.1 hypothetical protein [Salinibacter ruber]MCS3646540.1 hypothetical protein [Salinibacter ruber]MCS3674113.1 hypothetical protein [Salinibacter ruber]MCS3783964.1 hypothetical protein [Salinibacter ruber]MCS4137080.1 hypothetical protein [Salinibacter ruber]
MVEKEIGEILSGNWRSESETDIGKRGSVLFGVPRGMSQKLASELIDDGVINDLMPPQKTHRKTRRREIRRVLYNLIRAQSLSRAHSQHITLAVPLTMIKGNEREYHRVSYRGTKAVIETFTDAGLIDIDRGKPFIQCPTSWKKKCVEENSLRGKMTEVWAVGELEEKINDYLADTTDVGADVEILVEEDAVVLKDNDGGYIRRESSREARRMSRTVKEVNSAVPKSEVRLMLPLSTVSPLSTAPASPIREHTSPRWASLPPHFVSSLISLSSPPLSHASSPIRLHTSPQHRHGEVRKVMGSKLTAAHSEVKRRCPKAWSWSHRLSDDGHYIHYDLPNLALHYTRTFVRGSWDCGGRFYAPVQNIPSDWRKYMRIGEETVVELDYDNLHIAMLYAEEGKRLSGDAYDITSSFHLGAELDEVIRLSKEERKLYRRRQRTVVKKALNALINAENYQSAYGALKHTDWIKEIGVPLADEVFKPLVRALRSKHEAIVGHLHSDRGIRLQRKDSDLAHRVMSETGAIGIHDGFVIEESREEELRSVMKRKFAKKYDGYDIGVSREFKPLSSGNRGTTGAHEPSREQPSGSVRITPTPRKKIGHSTLPHYRCQTQRTQTARSGENQTAPP